MSKIVTIPNCSNPFVVIVNGVEYSYPAGQTVEVPDFIAAVIENHVNSHPQPAPPEPGVPSGPSVQSDWNQTDESQPDFIKNKTHGVITTVVLEEQELPYDPNEGACVGVMSEAIEDGTTVFVVFDGKEYKCKAEAFSFVFFGNLSIIDDTEEDTGEPFCAMSIGNALIMIAMDEENHTVKITANITRSLPGKYTPVTKLYVTPGSNHIYTDVFCTNPAFAGDIPDHVNFTIGITEDGFVGEWVCPYRRTSRAYDSFSGFASVTIIDDHGELIPYFSAEHG